MPVEIRPAGAADAEAIRTLVRGERLNPTGLDWRKFLVAADGARVIGCVQLRPSGSGAVELGSLAVRSPHRGQGIGSRLIEAALARARGRVLMITAAQHAARYRRWGFCPTGFGAAPPRVRLNFLMGQAGSAVALLHGMRPRRLAILKRRV